MMGVQRKRTAMSLFLVLLAACGSPPRPVTPTNATASADSASGNGTSGADSGTAAPATGGSGQSGGKEPIPRFSRIPLGESGLEFYVPGGDWKFEKSLSEDKSEVYLGEITFGSFKFAAIGVKLSEPIDGSDQDRDALLTGYMDFLAKQLSVTATAGHGLGHTLEDAPGVRGAIDYWKFADGDEAQVAGWVSRRHMAVVMIYGKGDYPYYNVWDLYRGGVRFPNGGE